MHQKETGMQSDIEGGGPVPSFHDHVVAPTENQPVGRAPSEAIARLDSFAARGHARWMVVAGSNPREKGIHDAAFGHYGATVATVSFEHEYSHMPDYGAKMAADYADRLVVCADAMKGVTDPREFVAAKQKLQDAARLALAIIDPMLFEGRQPTRGQLQAVREAIEDAMLTALGERSPCDTAAG